MRPLDVGIQLPEVEREVPWPEYAAMARAAEEVGFDSIWLGDHLLYRDDGAPERGPLEAWTLLAGLAAVTERVQLGPLVACVGFHPPAVLAKMAANVDGISGGRFVLGIGSGWNLPDFEAFDIPFDHRVSRFEEGFAIIRGLLAGERVTLDGRFSRVTDSVLLPKPKRHVPLMVGSNGARMLAITLPHVNAWNTWYDDYGNTAEGFAELSSTITEAARAAGREPSEVRRSACAFITLEGGTHQRPYDKEAPAVGGTPADIAAHLRALAEAGADEAIVVASPITEASIRSFGEVLAILDG